MKKLICAVVAMLLLMSAGCTMPESNEALLEVNDNAVLGGVLLGMTSDQMVELVGEPEAEHMSAGGTEYSYNTLDLSTLVDDGGTVVRLSTKNPEFSLFNISAGDLVADAAKTLQDKGYTADAAGSFRYNKDEIQVILLTIDGENVLGFTLEWLK